MPFDNHGYETARQNDLNPFEYLYYHLFEEIPKLKNEKEYEKLLPANVDRASLKNIYSPAVREI